MAKKTVCVLGAGLAGLSASWHLDRLGINNRVFEKESEPGGLCRSISLGDYRFDRDGHLLHFKSKYVFDLLTKHFKVALTRHRRSSWIYYKGVFGKYPFQANLWGLPPAVAKECLMGFINASSEYSGDFDSRANFLNWIRSRFGDGIARHFMIPYNRKFWTVPPQTLNCDWLDGFIPVPSLGQVVDGTVEDNSRQFGYNAYFWYPSSGSVSIVPEAFCSGLKAGVQTGCRVNSIDVKKKYLYFASGKKVHYDVLISTIPLPVMAGLIKDMPGGLARLAAKLKWNSVFNINIGGVFNEDGKKHWIYFPHSDVPFFRLGFYHNFSPICAPPGKGALYAEISYSRWKPLKKEGVLSKVASALVKTGFLTDPGGIETFDINDIEYAYPMYDGDYASSRSALEEYLKINDTILAGRYGSWRYYSMEDAILDGERAAHTACGAL